MSEPIEIPLSPRARRRSHMSLDEWRDIKLRSGTPPSMMMSGQNPISTSSSWSSFPSTTSSSPPWASLSTSPSSRLPSTSSASSPPFPDHPQHAGFEPQTRSRSNTCPIGLDLASGLLYSPSSAEERDQDQPTIPTAAATTVRGGGGGATVVMMTAAASPKDGWVVPAQLLVRLPVPRVDRFDITMDTPILRQHSPALVKAISHRRSSSESLQV